MTSSAPDSTGESPGALSDPILGSLFELLSDAICLIALDGRFVDANPAACQLLGYTREELLSKRLFDVIFPLDSVPAEERWPAFLARGKTGGDTTARHKDGTRIQLGFRAIAHVRPGIHASIFLDRRERDDTAAELARSRNVIATSERVQRAIGDAIDYGSWVCDPDGRNTYASPSFLALVGMTQEQCSNFGWGEVLHPDDAAETIAAWKACSQSGTHWERTHRFKGVDGEWHPILARGVPVRDDQGKILCWAGVNIDVSQLKLTEDKLRASEAALRAADRRKDDFLAMLSHDLRNPLGVVSLNLQLLARQQPAGEAGERGRKWVNTAQRAVQSMHRLIHDLLATNQIENGKLRLIVEPRDAAQLVKETLDDLRSLSAEKNIRLEGTVEPSLEVRCDLERMGQVFGNLVGNAIKFTPDGGTITVRGEKQADGHVRFTVTDSGAGIAPELLPHIFDPYWQEHPGRHGIGLGLFIARGIVEAHGGRIWAESPPGKGTTLLFTLPG